jgi:hypothetical protein
MRKLLVTIQRVYIIFLVPVETLRRDIRIAHESLSQVFDAMVCKTCSAAASLEKIWEVYTNVKLPPGDRLAILPREVTRIVKLLAESMLEQDQQMNNWCFENVSYQTMKLMENVKLYNIFIFSEYVGRRFEW